MTTGQPPRYVPTLTEIVSTKPQSVAGHAERQAVASDLVAAIMQEVDMQLQARLREIVARVVVEHVQGMAPTLRNEIENTVDELVRDALAKQLR